MMSDNPSADHPQRYALHNEIHARPPIALWPNERIINQAFILDAISRRQQLSWINRASSSFPLHHGTAHNPSIRVLEIAPEPRRILLKWEMHGEFVSVTIFSQQSDTASFESRDAVLTKTGKRLESVNAQGLNELTGQRLVALDIALESAQPYPDAYEVAKRFSGNTVVGSVVTSNQNAQLWTDLQLDEAGFIQMILRGPAIGSRQAGRTVQRMIDAETYRMMALLALPHAKSLAEPLRSAELELARVSEKIATAQKKTTIDLSVDAQLLGDVSALAGEKERHELVKRSLVELNETTIPGVQMLNTFMDRRFEPAMRTCKWTVRRLRDLSDRISRTSQILKTRIEFVNESQQQELLSSMDRRAKLQLRLQQTVEGLSIIVMTYYATGLLQYVAKGLKEYGVPLDPDQVGLVSVPTIAIGLLWYLTVRRRKQPPI
jgi:uncharacterized membrane-anchored protein